MINISWLFNRLRQMSVNEVFFRIKRSLLQKFEKRRVLSGWMPVPQSEVLPKVALFGDGKDVVSQWGEYYSLDTDSLNLYLAGKIDFFGHESLDVGMPVRWHTEPITKTVIPLEFGKTLNYRDEKGIGNVKFIWELGRHQHLVPLALAYAVTGESKYKDAVVDQIESWIIDNPYGMGIHWCSSLEVALRLISWSLAHSFLVLRDGANGLFDAVSDKTRLGVSIYQQSHFIRNYLSLYSSANNHLIGELSGLWTACQVFDLGRDGEIWSDFAHSELEKQAESQVYPDGVNKEQAFYYHLWVLEYFVFVWLVGSHSSRSFSKDFSSTIVKMSCFLKSVTPSNGVPPQFGDADDGFVARFDPFWPKSPYQEITTIVDSLAGNGECTTQKTYWYRTMSCNLVRSDRLKNDWQRCYPEVYQQGGYGILGDKHSHIVFDAGPLGYLGIAAHGHADALSFCLAIDGEWWLVDPGTYAYHNQTEWRDYFRGTSAHNTVRVNELNQSTISGAFMWSQKAGAHIEKCVYDGGIQSISGIHDGYKDIGVTHKRELQYHESSNQLIIMDEIACSNEVKIEMFFHFSPEVVLEYDVINEYWVAKHENSSRQVVFILDKVWKVEIVKGKKNPILGWYSPALEEKVPANVLHGVSTVCTNTSSVSKILIK